MTNDKRKMILSHQAINSALDQQDRENMRELIGLQQQRIAALEAANERLRALCDRWKPTHDPIFCHPLPLVAGIKQASEVELTAELAAARLEGEGE